jgi:asparagine synthase (glutamine-hydrolysing)
MCGIYGSNIYYDVKTINKKLETIKFRGPDYTGVKEYETNSGKLVFGHNRLSIIDLDSKANQPFDYSNNISIVFNGEIYNYKELRHRFFHGKNFNTSSDTEVLCAMYERFGVDCVNYLNGMFAFVIYDNKKQILFGARDRLGKKPFYYFHSKKGFEFASQLLPICRGNNFSISEEARRLYFMCLYVPDPYSIFNEVKKLKAGERFIYNIKNNEIQVEKYWDIHANSCEFTTPKSYNEAVDTVDALLKESISKRLIADVPVGVYLSGGIDSSLISTYVSALDRNIQNFSIGFEESKYDESYYSRSVSDKLGVPYNHVLCNYDSAINIIRTLPEFYDEPFADSSAIPSSLLAQVTKQYVTVALGGDGGDELFLGYERYLQKNVYKYAFHIPYSLRILGANILKVFDKHLYAARLQSKNFHELYLTRVFSPYLEGAKFNCIDSIKSFPDTKYLFDQNDYYKAVSDFDIKTYMNYDCITKVDRASMRSALEVRCPLMDYKLVEYTRLIPYSYMFDKENGQKSILKTLLFKHLDRSLFARKKMGFAVPIGDWFRGRMKEDLIDTLNVNSLEDLKDFIPDSIIGIRDRHIVGQENNTVFLWKLYVYLNWWEQFNKRLSE